MIYVIIVMVKLKRKKLYTRSIW